MKISRGFRNVLGLGALLATIPPIYVLGMRTLIDSGVIERAANVNPQLVEMHWSSAKAGWPGHVSVQGFFLRVNDPVLQFELRVGSAEVDVVLPDLMSKKFHASHVAAEGVTFKLVLKVPQNESTGERARAFPPIEGLETPAVLADPPQAPFTPEQIAAMWGVQLDQVEADASEVWIMEYRYQGPAHISGSFALLPLRHLWLGPSHVDFVDGTLTAGSHELFSPFQARLDAEIPPVELSLTDVMAVPRVVSVSLRFKSELKDLTVIDLYQSTLKVKGSALIDAVLNLSEGRLQPESRLGISMNNVSGRIDATSFDGDLDANLLMPADGGAPSIMASAHGVVNATISKRETLTAEVSAVSAQLLLSGAQIEPPPHLVQLKATLGDATMRNTRFLRTELDAVVPVAARAVLKTGALTASATFFSTREYNLLRVRHAQLGEAELEGSAVFSEDKWRGVAFGRFGSLPLGLRLKEGALTVAPFVNRPWLGVELRKMGIEPDVETE